MNPIIKAQWLEALRSDRYSQTTGALTNGRGGYCCLGVLCDISKYGKWTKFDPEMVEEGDLDNPYYMVENKHDPNSMSSGVVPRSLALLIGLEASNPYVLQGLDIKFGGFKDGVQLSELNDTGFNFDQIADIIEWWF